MGSLLDDPNLLRSLVTQAKSSHSAQGRALDTRLSHQKQLGGDALAPSAVSARRRQQQEQLQKQKNISAAWGASVLARCYGGKAATSSPAAPQTHNGSGSNAAATTTTTTTNNTRRMSSTDKDGGGGVLQVPTLATVAPSFTKAADEGVEALGGTRLQGPGYTCMIGLVPTTDTVQCIDDDYELISSMRPYRYDAKRQAKEASLREASATPHPDLLRQLEPTLAAVCPTALIDVDSLPPEYLLHSISQGTRRRTGEGDDEDDAEMKKEDSEALVPGKESGAEDPAGRRGPPLSGTYSFVCQSRPGVAEERPRLQGNRQPGLGQYNPRYEVVEPRVTGGYIAAKTTTATAASAPRGLPDQSGEEDSGDHAHNEVEQESCASLEAAHRTQASGTMRGTATTRDIFAGTNYSRTFAQSRTSAPEQQERMGADGGEKDDAVVRRPGENVKGSSMFLSKAERKIERDSAAPDVAYGPYPDARSTTKRVPCGVTYDVPVNRRRRQPPVSGVPSAVYNVTEDIAANQQNIVNMQATTGRQAHWYGKKWGTERTTRKEKQHHVAHSLDFADVDAAWRATQPAERVAHLPPQRAETATDEKLRRYREAQQRQQQQANTVSVEMNLSYPPPLIGGPDKMAKARDFAKMPSRGDRERVSTANVVGHDAAIAAGGGSYHPTGPYDDGSHTLDDALAYTERRQHSVHINPRAPGHRALYSTTTPTELGEVPNLKWTKPDPQAHTTTFGNGSRRPDHLLPFHDLTYDTERAYKAIEPRVTGDPAIGSVMSRQRRDKIFATHGCGPQKILAYDNVDLPRKVKSVPLFEKQITKETQFVGHTTPSERWSRANPKAPGPGYYTASYKLVE